MAYGKMGTLSDAYNKVSMGGSDFNPNPVQFGPIPNNSGATAPQGNLGGYTPTSNQWTSGQNNFMRSPSTNYNADGTAMNFQQSLADTSGQQQLYDTGQSSLWNILNGRYRTASDPTGAITPMQQGQDPFTSQLSNTQQIANTGAIPNSAAPATSSGFSSGGAPAMANGTADSSASVPSAPNNIFDSTGQPFQNNKAYKDANGNVAHYINGQWVPA